MLYVNELAVLASALVALALGSIWYSPLVFGTHWQRAANLSERDLELSHGALIRSLLVGLVSNVIIMYVIAVFLRATALTALTYSELAILLIGLFSAGIASMVAWEKKRIMYFVIHVGYGILVVTVGVLTLSLWPW